MGTVPTPATAVAGVAATAAQGNSWRDSNNWSLSNHPLFIGTRSTTQSIPNNTATAMLLDQEAIDSDSGHSLVSNTSRYTPQTPGYHEIKGFGNFAAAANGRRQVEVRFNGATSLDVDSRPTNGAGAATHGNASWKAYFNGTTDYVEVIVFQDSGGAINIAAGSGMTVEWLRTA